jgi:hypothetical protein
MPALQASPLKKKESGFSCFLPDRNVAILGPDYGGTIRSEWLSR